MKVLFVLAILVVITAAEIDWFRTKRCINLDVVHNYRFQEHVMTKGKLLIAISDTRDEKECHVIKIDDNVHDLLKNKEYKYKVSEEIYNLIHDNKQNETLSSNNLLSKMYDDWKLGWECRRHKTFVMTYTPSFSHTTSMPQMSTTQ